MQLNARIPKSDLCKIRLAPDFPQRQAYTCREGPVIRYQTDKHIFSQLSQMQLQWESVESYPTHSLRTHSAYTLFTKVKRNESM